MVIIAKENFQSIFLYKTINNNITQFKREASFIALMAVIITIYSIFFYH